jgi:triosephosphate isomerase
VTTTRTPLMAGNWKMNLDHLQATHTVQKLAWTLKDAKHDYAAVEVVVVPPFTDLRSVQTLVDADKLQVEDDATVSAKARSAFAHGLVPIICVGEGLDVRKAGEQVPFTLAQVDGAFDGLTAEQAAQAVVAYEPVWAIGTGEVATPDDAQEVCAAIRVRLAELYSAEVADAVRVLYGGSVKSGNVASIMAQADVDGALVGGASLDPEEFARIARYQSHAV